MEEKIRILVVDNEEIITEVLKMSLGWFFAKVGVEAAIELAHSPDEAKSMIGKNDFNLLITDLSIPGPGTREGIEIARKARQKDPGMPWILITGNLLDDTRAEAEDLGVAVILDKPCHNGRLFSSVAKALGWGEEKHIMAVAQLFFNGGTSSRFE